MMACDTRIVELYETYGMSPMDIAIEEEFDIVAVKACLLQYSEKYRATLIPDEVKTDSDFTDNDLIVATRALVRLVESDSVDDNVKLRAAKYIRDDKKGRLDAVKQFSGLNINIGMLNEQLAKVNEKLLNEKKSGKVIDVSSVAIPVLEF